MGELFSLLCAVVWAVAVILFKRSGETLAPLTLNLFRIVVSLVLLAPTVLAVDGPLWRPAPWQDYAVLAGSGVLAIAVADTLFHRSLNVVGAGITAVIDCLYSPLVVAFAFLLIGERLSAPQLAGMVLVVGGVLIASRHAPPPGIGRAELVRGVLTGAAGMAALALGIVVAKPVLDRSPVLWATTVRQVGALAVIGPVALLSPDRRRHLAAFRPHRAWRFSLTGAVLGSYLALILWLAGMKYTQAGAAAILNQTSTIYVLLLASLVLGEPMTRRKVAAAALAVAGIVLVTLG